MAALSMHDYRRIVGAVIEKLSHRRGLENQLEAILRDTEEYEEMVEECATQAMEAVEGMQIAQWVRVRRWVPNGGEPCG